MAWIQSLAWELAYAVGVAEKKKREKQFDSVTVIELQLVPLLVTMCKSGVCVCVCVCVCGVHMYRCAYRT